ncbi:MAG: hypothetical protein NC120_07215 [Ruminococcus sp.]|nr:hypothetical protein [Ruminococcus sp.]
MWAYSDVLYHHGIKGQKWGVRRYQNPDGSLTAEGAKRQKRQDMMDKAFTKSIKNGKDKEAISPAEKIMKDTTNALDNASKLTNTVSSIKDRKRTKSLDFSSMSDDDLRKAINRLTMEKQLRSLSSENITDGMTHVKDILSITGSTVGITASVVGIIATIQKLKGS